ncbi:MAG: thioesterase [Bacteroidales bacterium]|nr:thioesterase [Bacteroidales bacterium]
MEKTTVQRDIESNDVDFSFDSTVYSIGNMFMMAANIDSSTKGFGVESLLNHGLTWVTLRTYIKVNTFPHDRETVTVETWVEDCTRITTQRNCTFKDAAGNHLVDITTIFALVDYETRRPVNILEKMPEFPEKFIIDEKSTLRAPGKLKAIVNPQLVHTHTVVFSDLDCNMHTTSFRYVLWVLDAISLDEHKKKQISELEVNFVKECRYGETVSVYREDISENQAVFEIKNEEGELLNRQCVTFIDRK